MRRAAALLAALAAADAPARAAEPAAPVVPRFVEQAAAAGVASVYAGDWEYMVGGGAAVFDCDGDAYPDLYLAGGAEPADLYRNVGARGAPLSFAKVADAASALDAVAGAYPLDVDGDGIMDLILLRVGEDVALRGLGDCRFERANEAWGFDGDDAWSTAFAATWEAGADWPTLAVGTYIDRREDLFPWGSCTDNRLHRPEPGARRFAPPVALGPSHCALSMLFTDWDRSGTPSLRVSNDREYYKGGQEQLWRLPPGGAPTLYGEADGWKPLRIWGMGIASRDLDADGYPEFFLTSMADNKLQALADPASGRPTYADVAYARGATAHRPYVGGEIKPSTAWHAQFEDVNLDGLPDLFVAKGNVDAMPDFAAKDPNNLLLQRADGRFEEAGDRAGAASMGVARGAALADFDLDGRPDLVVVNRRANAELWRNEGPADGGWLQLRLSQPGPNVDGVGAWVEVRADGRVQRREVTVGGGHAGGQAGWLHFGLGHAGGVEARVVWPGGAAEPWATVAPDGFYVLEPGAPPRPWTPPDRAGG